MPHDSPKSIGPGFQYVGADLYQLPTAVFGGEEASSIPANTITQSTNPVIQDTLRLANGQPLNLTNSDVIYVVKGSAGSSTVDMNEVCSIVDAEKGMVKFAVQAGQLPGPGIYLAAYNIFNADGLMMHQVPRYLQIIPDIGKGLSSSRPLTIAEIRLALRDYPASNTLLDEVEFTDEEIIWAITRPIDIFNSTPPEGVCEHGYTDFPYRGAHLDGVIGELLAIAAHHYMRNDFPYQSAGLTVSDKAKAANYLQLSENLKAKFREFTERKKYEKNIANGFLWQSGTTIEDLGG
tara:strand:- start:1364 stop:2239 length:876 start_codon:yes stop_codon:yes gene_type:complete